MAPFISDLLRLGGRGGKAEDNFNRTVSSGLGSTSLGAYPWTVTSGTWSVNGTRPTTSTSHSSNPLAVINPQTADVNIDLLVGAGDAIYFRVQDASNWWRLLWEGYQTSSCQTCCSTCCSSTCCSTCNGQQGGCCNQCSTCAGCTCSCCNTSGSGSSCDCGCSPCSVSCYYQGGCTGSCNCYSCNCYSCNCTSCNCTYYDNYRAKLQKMVGGTLTTVYTGSAQGSSYANAVIKVRLSGTNVKAYYSPTSLASSTLLYDGAQTDFSTVTKHGIGRGPSNYNSSALDNFVATWN